MIVVVRFSSLGDVLQCTAFLNELRKALPSEEIVFLTKKEFSDVVNGQPYVDRIVTIDGRESLFELRKKLPRHVDILFDLQVNLRSYLVSFLISPRIVKRVNKHSLYRRNLVWRVPLLSIVTGRRTTSDNIEDQISLLDGEVSARVVPKLYNAKPAVGYKKPVIGIAPCAKWKTKEWGLERFALLIDKVLWGSVFLFGSRAEYQVGEDLAKGRGNVFNFMGCSLREAFSMVKTCDVVVSNDSAAMHMAVALGVPVVALFGPTVREFGFYPRGFSVVLEREVSCRPCSLHGSNMCKIGTHECMNGIGVDEVVASVKKVLGGTYD